MRGRLRSLSVVYVDLWVRAVTTVLDSCEQGLLSWLYVGMNPYLNTDNTQQPLQIINLAWKYGIPPGVI